MIKSYVDTFFGPLMSLLTLRRFTRLCWPFSSRNNNGSYGNYVDVEDDDKKEISDCCGIHTLLYCILYYT